MSEAASGDARRHPDGKVEAIFRSLARDSRTAFVTAGHTVSWADWIGSVEQLAKNYASMRRSRVGGPDRGPRKNRTRFSWVSPCSSVTCSCWTNGRRARRLRRSP